MTQYLLSVHHREGAPMPTEDEFPAIVADVDKFNAGLQEAGVWVFAGGLHPVDTATLVDGRGDEVVVTDGPFGETKEWLGGFWIVEVDDLDAAMRLAAEGSRACREPVEVRPFQDG